MKIRIVLPWEDEGKSLSPLEKAKSLSELRQNFERHRLFKVLTQHQVQHRLLEHVIFATLGSAKSGCSADEIYTEILLAFDFPIKIIKENNALVG